MGRGCLFPPPFLKIVKNVPVPVPGLTMFTVAHETQPALVTCRVQPPVSHTVPAGTWYSNEYVLRSVALV